MHKNIAKKINVVITHYPCLSVSRTGTKEFGTPKQVRGFPEIRNKIIRNAEGEEILVTATIHFDFDEAKEISVNDELELPSSHRRPVLAISPIYSIKGELRSVGVYL